MEGNKETGKKVFTIANIITILRILLVPVFVITFYFYDGGESYTASLVVFLIACLTDLLDGMVARIKNQSSRLGAVLDPFADKLMQAAALISFTVVNIIPLWFTITLLVIYVIMIIAGTVLFGLKREIESNIFGKLGSAIMCVGIIMCFFANALSPWHMCALYAGLAIVVVSNVVYIIANKEKFLFSKEQKHESSIDKAKNL